MTPTKHEQKLARHIRRSAMSGDRKKTKRCIVEYFRSHDALLRAANAAWLRMPKHARPAKHLLPKLAKSVSPWCGTQEPVSLEVREKPTKPGDFRSIMNFGIENRFLQFVALRALQAACELHPSQYCAHQGRHPAILEAASLMAIGYVHCAEIDVMNCFQSFRASALMGLLPLPKEVTSRIITGTHLNIVPGKFSFGLDGDACSDPLVALAISEARQGIPQGSAVSPFVSEWILSSVFTLLPPCGRVLNYADNFLLMAKSKEGLALVQSALCDALRKHPAGPLVPNPIKHFVSHKGVDFIGYRLTLSAAGVHIEPTPRNLTKFRERYHHGVTWALEPGISAHERARRFKSVRRFIIGWTSSFSLSPEAGGHLIKCLAMLHKAMSSCNSLSNLDISKLDKAF